MNGRGRKRDCVALTRRVPLAPAAGLLKRKMEQGAEHLCFYASAPSLKQAWRWGRGIKKTALSRCFHFAVSRRKRDSNPRCLSAQRFSRPPQSTTLPSLRGWVSFEGANVGNVFGF